MWVKARLVPFFDVVASSEGVSDVGVSDVLHSTAGSPRSMGARALFQDGVQGLHVCSDQVLGHDEHLPSD